MSGELLAQPCFNPSGVFWSDFFAVVGILIPNVTAVALGLISIYKLRSIEQVGKTVKHLAKERRKELDHEKANGKT